MQKSLLQYTPCVGKRELVFLLIVHLFVSSAHFNLCHFFSSSWRQGLAATSACGFSWTFLFTFLFLIRVVNRFNLLFILPLSGIMSPSLAATTDSRFVSYRNHLRKRTEIPEIKCSSKI